MKIMTLLFALLLVQSCSDTGRIFFHSDNEDISYSLLINVDSLPSIAIYNRYSPTDSLSQVLYYNSLKQADVNLNVQSQTLNLPLKYQQINDEINTSVFLFEHPQHLNLSTGDDVKISIQVLDHFVSAQNTIPSFLTSFNADSIWHNTRELESKYAGSNNPSFEHRYFKRLLGDGKKHYLFTFSGYEKDSYSPMLTFDAHFFNINLPEDIAYIPAELKQEYNTSDPVWEYPYRYYGYIWDSSVLPALDLEIRLVLRSERTVFGFEMPNPNLYIVETDSATYHFIRKVRLQENSNFIPFSEPVFIEGNVNNGFGIFGFTKVLSKTIFNLPLYYEP